MLRWSLTARRMPSSFVHLGVVADEVVESARHRLHRRHHLRESGSIRHGAASLEHEAGDVERDRHHRVRRQRVFMEANLTLGPVKSE